VRRSLLRGRNAERWARGEGLGAMHDEGMPTRNDRGISSEVAAQQVQIPRYAGDGRLVGWG
jgi:hypothetical protein